jgi:hypothetical protein
MVSVADKFEHPQDGQIENTVATLSTHSKKNPEIDLHLIIVRRPSKSELQSGLNVDIENKKNQIPHFLTFDMSFKTKSFHGHRTSLQQRSKRRCQIKENWNFARKKIGSKKMRKE